MKTEIQDINSTKKKLSIHVAADEVNNAFSQAYKTIGKKANIKGFRKGKVPNAMLERYYGSDIHMESLNTLVQNSYTKALEEYKLVPLMQPKFDIKPMEQGKDYSFEVEMEVKPAMELKEYKGITLKKREAKVSDEELNKELQRIQEARADLKPAEGAASLKEGFVGTLDFEGTLDGQPFQGGTAKGHILEYGKGQFLKEFEEKITGMKTSEERDIDVTFPADYFEPTLQNKTVKFHVTLQALHTKELPKLDDEFAKDMGKESLDAIKQEIRDFLTRRQEQQFRSEYAEEAVEYLLKKNPVDIPEGVLSHEMEHNKKSKEDAEKTIRTQFVLDEIAAKESIKAEPQDLENRFREMSQLYQQPVNAIKNIYYQRNLITGLISQITMEKTLDFVIDNATLK